MRWTTSPVRLGDVRVRRRFAWLPTEMRRGAWVWMEHYRQTDMREATPETGGFWMLQRREEGR